MLQNGDLVILSALSRNPFFRHAAVYVDGYFYHLNESGAHCTSYEDLVVNQGREILRVEHGVKTPAEIVEYYKANSGRKWDKLHYNCEHFAYGAAFGEEISPTISGYIVIAIIAAITLILSIIGLRGII